MAGSTTESVGASTAEISGVFGRGVVENESLAAFGEVKCTRIEYSLKYFLVKFEILFGKYVERTWSFFFHFEDDLF